MRPTRDLLAWSILLLALAGHWLLFARYVDREITWRHAANFDQTASLHLAYQTFESARQDGPLTAVARGLRASPPTGVVMHLAPLPLFALWGPSRLAALAVNWLAFALLQIATVLVARALGGWALAALALGLLWAARAPFYWIGGLDDFRSDLVAYCLYGCFVAAVVWSDGFRRRGAAIAAGGLAAACVLERALTSAYLGVLLAVYGAIVLFRYWRASEPGARADARRVVGGLLACGACLAAIAGPVLAFQAHKIWNYYVVGHVTGMEKYVRAANTGVTTAAAALAFYPLSVWIDHLGANFVRLSGATLAVLLLGRLAAPAPPAHEAPRRDLFIFVALAVLVPLVVLNLDMAKSPVVGAIVVPPIAWLVVLASAALSTRTPRAIVAGISAAVLLGGAAYQVVRLTGASARVTTVAAYQDTTRLHLAIAETSAARGWTAPSVLADRLHDYAPSIRVTAYERRRQPLDVQDPLGSAGVLAPTDDLLERAIAQSDFVIVTRPGSLRADITPNPFAATMRAWYPRLVEHCARERVALGTFHVPEEVTLYVRPMAAASPTTAR
ncbi:MAG: hypothetical protein ABW221_02850 [Vicinamibacteria bacterium]